MFILIMVYNFLGLVWTTVFAGFLGCLYILRRWESDYFSKRGINSLPTNIPFLGHMAKVLFKLEHMADMLTRTYRAFPDDLYVGIRQFRNPVILIRDLDLIKQIAVKDFDFFQDRIVLVDKKMDPLLGNNLVSFTGQKWRDMRATLSPAFTSSKMKAMFEFVVECGEEMTSFFSDEMNKEENKERGFLELDMKDTFTRYTNDVIATSAFGIKVNSHRDRNNEFYLNGKETTSIAGIKIFKVFLIMLMPKIASIFNVKILAESVTAFFRSLVSGTMQTREEKKIIRPDMIHLLMEAKKGSLKHEETKDNDEAGFATVQESQIGRQIVTNKWTDDELIAQAVIFFFAGFETSSNLLCFMSLELAFNREVQEKLQKEVDEVASRTNGKITYAELHAMKYMDMVVTETLRRWPPGAALNRVCVKKYTFPPPNDSTDKGVTVNPGEGIFFPIYDIHHDSKYYKYPKKFNPERFSEENKESINPLAYLPFGIGPRNCIGSRFALMECKSIIFQILQKFDIVPSPKTTYPVVIKKGTFNFTPKNGFWIKIKPREIKH